MIRQQPRSTRVRSSAASDVYKRQEYTDARFNKGNPRPYNQDSAGIQHSIDKGAKYLIVNGIKELYNKPYLQSYCTHLAGNYNNVLIFNLKNGSRNFNLTKQT